MNDQFNSYARPVVAQASLDERLGFLRRVYGWMTAALVVAGAGAAISIEMGLAESLARAGMGAHIVVLLGWMGLAYVLQKVRHVPTVNVLAFAAYALFTGFVISDIVWFALFYAQYLGHNAGFFIYQAMGLTAITFGALTTYAFFTKRDFSFLRGLLFVGLIAMIGIGLMAWLFNFASNTFAIGFSFLGVMIFSGYVLYDTQQIVKNYPSNEHVAAAMQLFLDFVLLFVYILNLLMSLASSD